MLISVIFDISDPLKKLIEIIIKVDQCISTGSVVFYLCTSFGGDGLIWDAGRLKKDQKRVFWTFFDFFTPWIWL